MAQKSKKDGDVRVSTEHYKGVRDFYPDDMYIQNYIFDTMRRASEQFGYVEYNASILEPSELYEAKSGEEIVNEQTYTFTDRGERSVTLRPEMTPTVARMVAAKKRELAFPLRWFSIPNLFRYERPQRGRLREHWQLNVDLFGLRNTHADIEIISVADNVMKSFGANSDQYEIRINSRAFMEHVFEFYSLSNDERHKLSKLIDRKNKIDEKKFKAELEDVLSEKGDLHDIFFTFITKNDVSALSEHCLDSDTKRDLDAVLKKVSELGITNAKLDVSVMRGFDYYTGMVFEVFDTSPENTRSLFGGGRYDDLLNIFGMDSLPAVGFGMGDVTIRDFLETHNLLPQTTSPTDVYICVLHEDGFPKAQDIADELRKEELNVAIDYTDKKVGDQIKTATKLFVPFTFCIGEDEIQSGTIKLKNLRTGEETVCKSTKDIVLHLKG